MKKHQTSRWKWSPVLLSLVGLILIILFTDPQFWWAKAGFLAFLFVGLFSSLGIIVAAAGTLFATLAFFHLGNTLNFLILVAITAVAKYNWHQ